MTKLQQTMVKFLLRHPETWQSYARDRETVECVCALHNLGIITLQGGQMILRSYEAAERFLGDRA